jgi:DNA-binding response OmpR family regulator
MLTKKASVLAVDDDIRMMRMVKRVLELEGFQVTTADSGESFLEMFEDMTPDLVLLDLMLPDIDGYALCRRIREFSQMPIIIVTARGKDEEKVQGLDIGADDYITKPFSASELVARVRAVLRRVSSQNKPAEAKYRFDGLVIDFASQRVSIRDKEIVLTPIEYRLLSYISSNAGRVITPDQLLNNVWGEEYIGSPHLLHVNIARLRQKLGDDARKPVYILTRPGIGYIVPKTAS